jgi:hypothetical protein
MDVFWAEVEIEMLPVEAGGRSLPLTLCNDHPGQYRPHLRVVDGSGSLLGVAFMDGPDEPVSPGTTVRATIKALYEPEVSYAQLKEGVQFEILEGPRVVGHGRILRL